MRLLLLVILASACATDAPTAPPTNAPTKKDAKATWFYDNWAPKVPTVLAVLIFVCVFYVYMRDTVERRDARSSFVVPDHLKETGVAT